MGIQALSIHGRTRKQMYKGEADWTLIGRVKDNPRINIPIFGNGDINSPEKAKLMKETYGVDGIMIGRASIGNPWIFNEIKHFLKTGEKLAPPAITDRYQTCLDHLDFSLRWKGEKLGVVEMRRHYSNYFKGFHGFKPYRMRLVTEMNPQIIRDTLIEVKEFYTDYVFNSGQEPSVHAG